MTRFAPQYRPRRGRDVSRPLALAALAAGAFLYGVTWTNVNQERLAVRVDSKAREVRRLQQEILVLEAETARREQAVLEDTTRVRELGLAWPRAGRVVVLDPLSKRAAGPGGQARR
jgi:hypothetical protein